jgi:hypothetical protein
MMAALNKFAGQGVDIEFRSSQEREVDDWNENLNSSPPQRMDRHGCLVVALLTRCG